MANALVALVQASAGPVLSPVRVRPAPPQGPPLGGQGTQPPTGMEMLPLTWLSRHAGSRRPADGRPARHPIRHAGRPPASDPWGEEPSDSQPQAPHAVIHHFVHLCTEVLNGFRPVAQLRPLTMPQRFGYVAHQISRRIVPPARRQGSTTGLVRVRRIRWSQPTLDAVEAVVVFDQEQTSWAMAIRLEDGPLGWRCVLAQMI